MSFQPENVVRTRFTVHDMLLYLLYSSMFHYALKLTQRMFWYCQVLSILIMNANKMHYFSDLF